MGLMEAKDHGAETCILLDHEGKHVTEGPGFNVFSVSADGRVVTADSGMLEGVTRRSVLEICAELGLEVECRPLSLDEFMRSAEVFLSSSGGGVMPITKVDDTVIGDSTPGKITRRIRERYWQWMARPEMRTEIKYK